jgi:hypothetical protein
VWSESSTWKPVSDADVFSVIVELGDALGLASTSPREQPTAQWAHNDAGEDLRVDGTSRELAWLQCSPIWQGDTAQPVISATFVLATTLRHFGKFRLDGLHAVTAQPEVRMQPTRPDEWIASVSAREPRPVTFDLWGHDLPPADVAFERLKHATARVVDGLKPAPAKASMPSHHGAWRVLNSGAPSSLAFAGSVPHWDVVVASFLLAAVSHVGAGNDPERYLLAQVSG